ncbi:MAG: polyprenyl synthetase family protein [Bacteroidia bacterium]|nr:polyprenyl synthetase family protein [Bacteroidia bacterium]
MFEIISPYQINFNKYLNKYIQLLQSQHPQELYQPIEYILKSEAKYIRPILCLMACEMYGKHYKHALPAALSIELFHTFSLVHDDILDNSPIRRGKKTIHTKWNTNMAILAGDVLLVESFKVLTTYPAHISYSLYKQLAYASVQICEGQQEDMNFEKQPTISTEQYLEMIRKKTSVLLGTALQMGAIAANASQAEQKKLYQIGETIGIAFQIMDDFLDTFGNTKKFGKKIGNDILHNKKTFLLTKALEISSKKELSTIKNALKMPPNPEKIKTFQSIYKNLNIDTITLNTVEKLHQKIAYQLQKLNVKNQTTLQKLIRLSEQLIQRNK